MAAVYQAFTMGTMLLPRGRITIPPQNVFHPVNITAIPARNTFLPGHTTASPAQNVFHPRHTTTRPARKTFHPRNITTHAVGGATRLEGQTVRPAREPSLPAGATPHPLRRLPWTGVCRALCSARTCPRFETTRHVASRKAPTCRRTPKGIWILKSPPDRPASAPCNPTCLTRINAIENPIGA